MHDLPEFWLSCEGKAWPELPEVTEVQKQQMHVDLWVGGIKSLRVAWRDSDGVGMWGCNGGWRDGQVGPLRQQNLGIKSLTSEPAV